MDCVRKTIEKETIQHVHPIDDQPMYVCYQLYKLWKCKHEDEVISQGPMPRPIYVFESNVPKTSQTRKIHSYKITVLLVWLLYKSGCE